MMVIGTTCEGSRDSKRMVPMSQESCFEAKPAEASKELHAAVSSADGIALHTESRSLDIKRRGGTWTAMNDAKSKARKRHKSKHPTPPKKGSILSFFSR